MAMRLNRGMGVVETGKLPTGKRARAEFVAALEASDDRVENHYLEVKSGFDLNSKADRRKVVKFILGAAHRDPVKAARHFGGHAVMVLGLPLNGVRGVDPFDVKDLANDIATYAGAEPPGWDIDLVPVGDGRDVVLIIVDPPDGRIWPVLQTSDFLVSGDVYMRAEGETRRISGPELLALMARAHGHAQTSVLDVSVQHIGVVEALVIDSAELRDFVEWYAEHLEAQVAVTSTHSPFGMLNDRFSSDRRSEKEFRGQIETWREEAMETPSRGVRELAAQMTRPFRLNIVNNTTTSLKEVRIDVTFDVPLTALYWERQGDRVTLFPDKPMDWGKDSFARMISLGNVTQVTPVHDYDGEVRVATDEPAELVVEMRRLHAEQAVVTPDEDVVLVLFVDDPDMVGDTITARWRLAAGEVNEVLKGELDVEVSRRDWRGPLHSMLSEARGDLDAEEDEA